MSLPRRFSPIQVRVKVGKLVYQQIVKQALLSETKHQLILGACVSTVGKSTTKESLCYHELNACEYFKIKSLCFYSLPVVQIFFIKLISKQAIIDLFLTHNTKRRNFFPYIFILFLVFLVLFLLHIA